MAADDTHHTRYHVTPRYLLPDTTRGTSRDGSRLQLRMLPPSIVTIPRAGSACRACPTTSSDWALSLSILLWTCTCLPHTPVWGYRDVASPRLGSVSSFPIEFGIPFRVRPLARYRHAFSVLPALTVNSHAFPAKRNSKGRPPSTGEQPSQNAMLLTCCRYSALRTQRTELSRHDHHLFAKSQGETGQSIGGKIVSARKPL